jgi:hypothetical protein
VDVSQNGTATGIDLGSLSSVGGDVTITSNAPNAGVNLGSLCEFGDATNATTMTLEGGTFAFGNCLTIGGNATLRVDGTVDGSVTNKGRIAPGTSAGRFVITGDLILAGSSELRLEPGGYAPGESDFLSVNGGVTLGGTLTVSLIDAFPGALTNGASFTLLTAGGPLTGAFANVPSGGTLTTADGYARFTVVYAGQNSLQLTNAEILNSEILDADHDGVPDATELADGTNPNDPASHFRIVSVEREAGGLRITWTAAGGKSYVVQVSDPPGDPPPPPEFLDFGPPVVVPAAGETTASAVVPGLSPDTPARRFIRIRRLP